MMVLDVGAEILLRVLMRSVHDGASLGHVVRCLSSIRRWLHLEVMVVKHLEMLLPCLYVVWRLLRELHEP